MICPRCGGATSAHTGRCSRCGASVIETSVLTGVIPIDTTGLPPGATFGASVSVTVSAGSATAAMDAAMASGVSSLPAEAGPLKVGQSFGPRYHIIKLLGVGGMGAVYQAWDAELSVAVALKVIRTRRHRPSQDLEKRFKNELLLARSVTHKNVVRIHDLGEIDNKKFITMSYVQGHDLATLLRQHGRFPIPRALHMARQIAAGLEAAHEAGVVHRDLKPANIMIGADDLALIMDFGISASTEEAASGGIIGTLEYMAPEQGAGHTVDGRSDIYAFGLILHEMLAGPRSVASKTPQDRVDAMKHRIVDGIPSLRELDPAIPEALAALVARCVETDPKARFQTTAELCAALARLDAHGALIRVRRVVGLPLAATLITLLLFSAGGAWWYARTLQPQAQHDPVSVVIADFRNGTGDAAFDRTLEPMLRRALEGAGFISAYDRNGIVRTLGVRPPPTLDETAAREVAVKQGLGVVVSGSIEPRGNGYGISLKATQAVAGTVLATANGTASRKDDVLGVATKLVTTIRKALGDKTSDSAQIFAMATVSATSLDVVRLYAAAQEAASNNKFEEARQNLLKALEIDPKFGIGYQLLAVASRNLGRLQDAERYSKEGLRYLDGMTERERFSTRGVYYRMTGDYQQCVKEYGELIARYGADVAAHNQRALCLSKLRNMREAMDEMQQVVRLLPKRAVFRDNLALYANYAGDFATAEREARTVGDSDAYATLALAFAQVGQGALGPARATYEKLQTMGPLGASFGASGLGDLALHEGRYADAARAFEQGAAADLAKKNGDKAAMKFAGAAFAHLWRGDRVRAMAAADNALQNGTSSSVRFLAARALVAAGASDRAKQIAGRLGQELAAEPQAYGKIIEADLAIEGGDARQAIKSLNDANALLDTWIGHFDLGRAYLMIPGATPQADSEFDRCLKRRGEALSLFLDEEPTSGFFPQVYYYQGRVRQALGTAGFADSYRAYLQVRGNSTEDPLVADIRQRSSR